MAIYNHKIEVVNGSSTDTFHPETNTDQVYDFTNSAWLSSIIGTLNSLTTTQKSSLVASINEIAGTKANTTALNAHTSTIATTSQLGHVKPDGTTITIDSNGVISSVGGGGSGGTPDAHTHPTSQIVGLDTALGLKAPLASPTFTGTPSAPTAANTTNTTQIATTAFVQSNISSKANLASPTFTGAPLAPTASSETNTTQIATTAFVTTAITNKTSVTGNAGTATKLATARTINGVSFDGTANITITDNTKAPLASPALTGVPTAPTPANTTNTTQIATTAFVQSNVSAHLSDYMPHDAGLSQYSSSVDANGFYRVVEYKRADNTLHLKSTASNPDTAGRYQTITWQFYATNGTTLALTKTWTITYDSNGVIVSKVLT